MMKREECMDDQKKKARLNDPGKLLILVYVSVIVIFLLFGSFVQARAEQTGESSDDSLLDEVKQGELILRDTATGEQKKAPLLSQKVNLEVNGLIVNAAVEQIFKNTSSDWVEAVYVFPLPDKSGIRHMRMIVGDKIIEGEIKEKKAAREIYQRAKQEGKKTSLLAQKRPNIFTMAVANIPPNGEITVEIEYLDAVRMDNNTFSLRFPMVVGPRYIPGSAVHEERTITFDGNGWSKNTDRVADATEITPHVVKAGSKDHNPIELELLLAPGFEVRDLRSLYHGTTITELEEHRYLLRFDGKVLADRDFVVEYQPANGRRIEGSLFSEMVDGNYYTYVMLMPPQKTGERKIPRDLIFVIDVSGSMAGESIRQAKKALINGVNRLAESDRINVIVFNSSAYSFYDSPVEASPSNREEIITRIESLQADGGTEIGSALQLGLSNPAESGRIRQLVFLTDGSVGNEAELFTMINELLGDTRLFTVGIGSAPNSYFMSRAASMGRGSYSYIGKVEEVDTKMTALFQKLENPVVTDLEVVDEAGEKMEMYPNPLPDLYMGEPVIGLIKTGERHEKLDITGRIAAEKWHVSVDGGDARAKGVAALWGRKKIESLLNGLHLGGDKEEIRRKVIETAITHHLVSRYTSLVAVEQKASRQEEDLKTQQIKNNLPHGWVRNKVFSPSSKTGTRSNVMLMVGVLLLLFTFLLAHRIRNKS